MASGTAHSMVGMAVLGPLKGSNSNAIAGGPPQRGEASGEHNQWVLLS